MAGLLCEERYYPEWSARGIRGVQCRYRARFEALVAPFSGAPRWLPVCGIHARRYETTRPLPASHDEGAGR